MKLVTKNTVVISFNDEMWGLRKKYGFDVYIDHFNDTVDYYRCVFKNFKTMRTLAEIFIYPKTNTYRFPSYNLFLEEMLEDVIKLGKYIRQYVIDKFDYEEKEN